MSNAHSSLGRDRWYMRMHSIMNAVFAQFTLEPTPTLAEV